MGRLTSTVITRSAANPPSTWSSFQKLCSKSPPAMRQTALMPTSHATRSVSVRSSHVSQTAGQGRAAGAPALESGNQSEKEFDPTRDAPIDLRLSGRGGHEVAAGRTLVQRDAVHMNLLADQCWRLGQVDGIRRDAPSQKRAATPSARRGLTASWHGDHPWVWRAWSTIRAVASDAAVGHRDGTCSSRPLAW
jgi:hypothetical protein